jgi:hypothetical protein
METRMEHSTEIKKESQMETVMEPRMELRKALGMENH